MSRRPELSIHLLLWDYSLLYAGERELLPRLSLGWRTPDRITLRLDSTVPFGSSQHQKIVVVDDAVAFSGGLDLTIRRWDTGDHEANNPPAGRSVREALPAIPRRADDGRRCGGSRARPLARQRWCRVNGGEPMIDPLGDPWPATVATDFTDVDIGIARTQPQYNGDEPAREVEVLFLESIEKARRSIYIENQFLTCRSSPGAWRHSFESIPSWRSYWWRRDTRFLDRASHHAQWSHPLLAASARRRCRARTLLYPSVEQAGKVTDTMIHSKVMIIDDCFLRVGSANLNNRSMGADTECDLAIEAASEKERCAIASVRNRLLGEHCGVSAGEVAAWVIEHRSLVGAADTFAAKGHRLCPIEDGEPDRSFVASLSRELPIQEGRSG